MLTTTLDGLWVLQVLTGLEVLAPELGLRPHFPHAETKELALGQPVAADLQSAGAIGEGGSVDEVIVEWLTVLARREVGLILYRHTHDSDVAERHLFARFAQWWVVVKRRDATVEIAGIGAATTEEAAASLIGTHVWRDWGVVEPAELRPLTLPADHLTDMIHCATNPQAALRAWNLEPEQAAILALAADGSRSTQVSVVAVQSGVGDTPTRSYVGSGAVTVIDTPRGRVLSEHICEEGKDWLVLGPGSDHSIARAVLRMLRRLPAQKSWHTYRKVV